MKRKEFLLAVCLLLFPRGLSAGDSMEKLREAFQAGRHDEAGALVPEALAGASREDSAEVAFYEASMERVAELADMKMMEIVRKYPKSPFAEKALLRSAIYQFETDNLARSEYLLRRILTEYLPSPLEPEVRLWLGRNYVRRGEYRSAKVELTHGLGCLGDYPKTPSRIEGELSYLLGEACMGEKDLRAAHEAYVHVTLLELEDPLLVLAMTKLTSVCEELGMREEAKLWSARLERRGGEALEEKLKEAERDAPPLAFDPPREEEPSHPSAAEAFWVQVGSFSSNSNAEELRKVLAGQGLDAAVRRGKVDGENVYRVRLGPFHEKNTALESLARLRQIGMDGRVLRGE